MTEILSRPALLALTFLATACSEPPAPQPPGDGVPAGLEFIQGNGQVGPVEQELPVQIVVRVVDEGGHPVDGVLVLWVGDGAPWVDVTDTAEGGITRNYWSLGEEPGPQQLELWVYDLQAARRTGLLGKVTATAQP